MNLAGRVLTSCALAACGACAGSRPGEIRPAPLPSPSRADAEEFYQRGLAREREKHDPQAHLDALRLYLVAAEQDHVLACWRIGVLYSNGRGVERSHALALRWFERSARLGNGDVMYYVADCYENGRGTARSLEKAIMWYRRAAEAGDDEAAHRVRELTRLGTAQGRRE